jgi:hypothetical protein
VNLPKPTIVTKENYHDVLRELQQAEVIGLDSETVGVDPSRQSPAGARDARIVCWSMACRDNWDRYRRYFLWADVLPLFTNFLTHAPVVGHNIFGFDWHMFANHDIELGNVVGCTLSMHRLLTNGRGKRHGLKHLLDKLLGIAQPAYKDVFTTYVPGGVRNKSRVTRRTDSLGVCHVYGTQVTDLKRILVPLDKIATDYPHLMEPLYEYATLDALGTLMLYERFVS